MIKRIVLTGGPCGGKTTSIRKIKEIYEKKGYIVLCIDETATQVINMGIKPFGNNEINIEILQDYVFSLQLFKENLIDKYISNNIDKDILVLYDRCILDNNSYVSDEIFNNLLDKFNINKEDYINKHDLYIHMVSAAIGTDEYTLSNNSARIENIHQAQEKDYKIRDCYKNVKNYIIIDNSTDFDKKINKVIDIINELIEE